MAGNAQTQIRQLKKIINLLFMRNTCIILSETNVSYHLKLINRTWVLRNKRNELYHIKKKGAYCTVKNQFCSK